MGIPYWVIFLILGLFLIFTLVSYIRFFRMMNKPWWHVFVPVLNEYDLFDCSWYGYMGVIYVILYFLYILTMREDLSLVEGGLIGAFSKLFYVSSFIIRGINNIKIGKSFNKSPAYIVGLIFMEEIFIFVLTCTKDEFLGKTLRKYNPVIQKKNKISANKSNRSHMINLFKRKSITALISGTLVFAMTFYAVAGGIVDMLNGGEQAGDLFKMFTTNSNSLSAIGAAFMIPFAIEGIRKGRFVLPKWVCMFQYAGAICTSITMVFALVFILPVIGPDFALGGNNFYLHIICPIFALILLFSNESTYTLDITDAIICTTPFYFYALLYIFNVVILGEKISGWTDIYQLAAFTPLTFTLPCMMMLSLGVSLLIRHFFNKLVSYRNEELNAAYEKFNDPQEIMIELYGLGLFNGIHDDINNINIPIDIFSKISTKTGIALSKINSAYVEGVSVGVKERKQRSHQFMERLSSIFGTPEKKSTAK